MERFNGIPMEIFRLSNCVLILINNAKVLDQKVAGFNLHVFACVKDVRNLYVHVV